MPRLAVEFQRDDIGDGTGYYLIPENSSTFPSFLITRMSNPPTDVQNAIMKAYADSLENETLALEFLTDVLGFDELTTNTIYTDCYKVCDSMTISGREILAAGEGTIEQNFGEKLAEDALEALA